MMKIRRVDWVVAITAIVFAVSCSGGGCGGCAGFEPIPGGFPAAKRNPNAAQVRVTSTGLATIAADPAKIIGPLVGNAMNGVIDFNIPGSCGGNPEICCVNNQPLAACGPLQIDLVKRPTDPARLVLTPVQNADRLDMTIRARVKTKMNLPIKYSGISCTVGIDTTQGSTPDLKIDAQIQFSQDPTTGTTRISANNVTVTQLESNDVSLGGGILCSFAGAFIGALTGTLQDQVASQIQSTINDSVCKACDSGQVAECGSSFATACTSNTCMVGNRCLQELGLAGRARGSALFGGFSPGTTGALDLYEVTGGYATSNTGGLALGLLGGMQPGGAPRDRCGPPGTEPATVAITPSTFFQGNVRPDTNAPFDVGIGVHKSQLGQFAWAGYDGGLLCLTIGNSTVPQLSTDTLGLVSRSLGKLVETNAPMALGLRPQSPPTIVLGKNTFMDDGMGGKTLVAPLLDLTFTAMEIDFFVAIDDQYVRAFTVVSDVHLPIGLQVAGMGEIVPVIGAVDNAFTNVSVKNADALTESPAELAALFPTLLNLVLPSLSGGLGSFTLPEIGGLALSVTDITAVDNDSYLAIFANLTTVMARPVTTSVTLAGVAEPDAAIARDPKRWAGANPPAVTLDYGDAAGLEWSYRLDDGTWTAWSTNRRPTIAPTTFWLPGQHKIEVRAREVGKPETIDLTPETIEVVLGTDLLVGKASGPGAGFHGQAGSGGCACDASGNAQGAGLLGMLIVLIVLPLRRAVKRAMKRARRLGAVAWLAAIACLPGCSCSSDPCGSVECLEGEVPNGGLGRYTSIAGDSERVLVATYDQGLGDLVVGDATDPANVKLVVVDGVPDVTPVYEPSTYRGGIEDAGDDVGVWTAIAISGGLGKVAYQDRTAGVLKYAFETKKNAWKSYVLDPGNGELVGQHTSIVVDGVGHPAIAYLATGIDDGAGHRTTELRLARAGVKEPSKQAEWTTHTIVSSIGTCAGSCESGQACIAGAMGETCSAITTDCTGMCADGEACVAGACTATIAEPMTTVLASGAGLFSSIVLLPDGRLAVAYYDRPKRSLVLAVENAVDANAFTEVVLDQSATGDRGMWASAAVDDAGVVHVAYQDAIGDQLMYTTWNGTAAGTPEVVDDGQRAGDRTHTVGASAAIYLVNGAPAIAYQDGLTSDVYVATKGGTAWTTNGLATGPLVDGIAVAATTGHGAPYIAYDSIDPATSPLNHLVVKTP